MTYVLSLTVLADGTRRQIFERLREGPLAVGVIAAGLPVSRPAVSQHLKVLKDAGLVSEQRAGARRLYALRPEGLAGLRAWLDQFWDATLQSYKQDIEQTQEIAHDEPGPAARKAKHHRRSFR